MSIVRVLCLIVTLVALAPRAASAQTLPGAERVFEDALIGATSVTVEGSRAYVSAGRNLIAYDVSDARSPRELGRRLMDSGLGGTIVVGQLAYVIGGPVVYIVDVSDPARLTIVGSYRPDPTIATGISAVAVGGRYMFAAAGSDGIRAVDVSDPTRPVDVGGVVYDWKGNRSAASLALVGDYLYAGTVTVLSVYNVADPTRFGEVFSVQFGTEVVVQGRYAYVGGIGPMRVFDVADPARPVEVAQLPLGARFITAAGDRLYVADGASTLNVLDISDPTRPTQIASQTGNSGRVGVAGGYALTPTTHGLEVWRLPGADPPPFRPRAYVPMLPQLATIPGAAGRFVSSLTVQNPTTATAQVTIAFRAEDGSAANATTMQLEPGRGRLLYLPSLALPPGRYGAVVSSDQPVAAIANVAVDSPTGSASYSAVAVDDTRRSAFVNGLFKQHAGLYSSTFVIQNPSESPATATVTYRDASGRVFGAPRGISLPPNGSVTLAQGAPEAALPENFVGSAIVTADQPIATVVFVASPTGELAASTGVSAPNSYVPVAYKAYSPDGWMSSLLVQNLDPWPKEVTLWFEASRQGDTGGVFYDTVPGYGSRQYNLADDPVVSLPATFVGSVRVEGSRFAVIANARNAAGNLSSGNATRRDRPTATLYFPALYNDYSPLRWASSIAVNNVGDGTLTIEYFDNRGELVRTVRPPVESGRSAVFYLPNPAHGPPPGFAGSARVTASGGQFGHHIRGLANTTSLGQTSGDWLLTSEAIPG